MLKRQHAMSTARPFTAAIVAVAGPFCFNDGVLVYSTDQQQVRILDTRNPGATEIVIDYVRILEGSWGKSNMPVTPVNYSHGILALVGRPTMSGLKMSKILYVVDVRKRQLIGSLSFQSPHIPWVRNNENYLVFGARSELVIEVLSRLWALRVMDLQTGQWNETKHILYTFGEGDVGSNIDFEILNGYVYATAITYDQETTRSTYSVRRFSLGAETVAVNMEATRAEDMFRLNSGDRACDDRYASIKIEQDDVTGEPMIREQRREWLISCGSDFPRACYRQRIIFPRPRRSASSDSSTSPSTHSVTAGTSTPPPNSPGFSHQAARTVHPIASSDGRSEKPPRLQYHAAAVFAKGYHTPSQTFLDLVRDPRPNGEPELLRIRTISAGPHHRGGANAKTKTDADNPAPPSNTTSFWPRSSGVFSRQEDAFLRILNPPMRSQSRTIESVFDDESATLVYAVEPSRDVYGVPQTRFLVLVSFDPRVQLAGLPRRCNKGRRAAAVTTDVAETEAPPWDDVGPWRIERAAYLSIAQNQFCRTTFGYDFSY